MRAGQRPTEEFQGSDPRVPFCRASVVARLVRRLELPEGTEVLEWGVARGSTAATLVKLGMKVTLVEADEEALDRVLQETRVEVNAVKAERPPATMADRFGLILLHARDALGDDVASTAREFLAPEGRVVFVRPVKVLLRPHQGWSSSGRSTLGIRSRRRRSSSRPSPQRGTSLTSRRRSASTRWTGSTTRPRTSWRRRLRCTGPVRQRSASRSRWDAAASRTKSLGHRATAAELLKLPRWPNGGQPPRGPGRDACRTSGRRPRTRIRPHIGSLQRRQSRRACGRADPGAELLDTG